MTALESQTIRPSVLAGSWYPGNAKGLTSLVDDYLNRVDQPPIEGQIMGLISPHAGYAYSGQTAAYAYRQLQGRQADTVVIMAPSHRAWVGDYAISAEDAYETPLGRVSLDQAFISDLEAQLPIRRIRHDSEHSLEIQLPFLQRQLAEFHLVPVMMSADEPRAAQLLAATLAAIIGQRTKAGKRVLLVASSDLHHMEDYEQVVRHDEPIVNAVAGYDLERLESLLMAPDCSVCGRIPILSAMYAARELGAGSARVLYHTNSGDVTGQRRFGQYTVGYMAAAIYQSL
jgi:AmmeMemoRadiSam system protein B